MSIALAARPLIVPLAVAATIFWLGYDGGTYGLDNRTTVAIAVWWAVTVTVALGVWPRVRIPAGAILAGALLAALAALALSSMAWAPSAERAFVEFDRISLYLGVYIVTVLASVRSDAERWSDGLALGIAAIAVLALASRLFPTLLPAGDVPDSLPSAATRLSWPVEYWNGLAILTALAFPLLLRIAVAAGSAWGQGLAVSAFPALAAVIYLTSSRGGVATALIGTVAFAVLTPRRWRAAGAIAAAAAGAAAAVAVLLQRPELVNAPYTSPLAPGQGRSAAVLIVLVCGASGVVYVLAATPLSRAFHPPPLAGRIAAAAVVAAAVVACAAADPVERFETFKAPPQRIAGADDDFVRAHLLSGNGSGRWQFWSAALEAFEREPLTGRGAGSYESWWAQHGTIAYFVRDAHSLYLEALAELGIVGGLLAASMVAAGATVAFRRRRGADDPARTMIAALLASFLAYAAAAAIDWMWELTIVSVVGIVLLGLLTGPATDVGRGPRAVPAGRRPRPAGRFATVLVTLVVGWFVICAQAIPLLAQTKLRQSEAAVAEGDARRALAHAASARNLQPWAASPYLQTALVAEQSGDLVLARQAIAAAIERDRENWRLWLVAARIEAKSGDVTEAQRTLARAAALNPRSPLFSSAGS